jgi:mono/diheme cytochrome c family protein
MRIMSVVGSRLLSLNIALTGGIARAQDLDEGKSGAQLFAAHCAACHRSPRGLAKDRFSWTLSYFLRQHYTSSSASAQALTAYLQSVDAPRGKPPPARKSMPPATSGPAPPLRPPAPVPTR